MQHEVSRRDFLRTTAAAAAVSGMAHETWAQESGLRLGAQSYSFRQFSFEDSLKRLKELGLDVMEFCSVHFPPDAEHPNFGKVKQALLDAGVAVPCFGVEGFGKDKAANRKRFEFAKALGIEVLTADVERDAFDDVEALCEEFKVKIAIHNHGPGARYDKVTDTLTAVEGRSPLLGACVDTGHSIRSGDKPHEVIQALGSRVISLHLKDWLLGGEEQILGEGELDLTAVAKALKALAFNGPAVFEYENHPENPVPDMVKGLANWRAAWQSA